MLKRDLEQRFFPFVIKPGRYAGGELGQIVKDPAGRVAYLHCYPDKYEIGHSYPGLQTLYHVVNGDDRFLCERAFAVDRDAEELLRKEKLPLFSLESRRAAKEFDAIGFTLVDETVYTNLLAMLDLAQIPLRSVERTDSDPLVLAGGPAVFNPEPIADFVDVVFIGDGEEGLPEMLAIIGEMRGKTRREKLEALVRRVESVYVPQFYDELRKPQVDFAPAKITARVIPELKPEYYPDRPIVPLIETVHNFLGVEIMRGCPQGCRFCLAGTIYRPVRIRPQHEIMRQVETQLNNTGYDEVSLTALSTTDYPEIEPLAATLSRRLEPQRVSIGLPSLRPGSISPLLLESVKRVRKSGLTIAAEAGTERLRLFIRKDFPDAAIYDTVRLAFDKGWQTIKLYFMIGLPTETDDDLHGIADIIRAIHQIGQEYPHKKTINVTLSPFIPKAHTPFQWDEASSEETAGQKIGFVKRHTRINQVAFKVNNPQLAILSTILGRGGRAIGRVVETAFRNGCRFEGWSEDLRFDIWLAAMREQGIEIEASLRPIPFSADLPWSHIEKGRSVESLVAERQRTSITLRDFVPHAPETVEEKGETTEYGRNKKKVVARNVAAPTKNRARLQWGKSERYRFMSHLDNLRMIERALRRARVPISYSQGFNPTPKLSFGPPLPLGFTSEAEFVDITLDVNLMGYMIDSLRMALPDGFMVLDAKVVLGKTASLSSALNRVRYEISSDCWVTTEHLQAMVDAAQASPTLMIERPGKQATRTVDIRPSIYELAVVGNKIVMLLGLGEGGYARPTEVAQFLSDGLLLPINGLPFHRKEMYRIETDNSRINAMEL
jgi:radical SAM family uncharacterized protein/radical SAM-linked protein